MSSFLDALVDGVVDEIPVLSGSQLQNASRSIMLLTKPELDDLVTSYHTRCNNKSITLGFISLLTTKYGKVIQSNIKA